MLIFKHIFSSIAWKVQRMYVFIYELIKNTLKFLKNKFCKFCIEGQQNYNFYCIVHWLKLKNFDSYNKG
jgi:hypothetical protein